MEELNVLLKQSLFYYCSGKDPTPIIAFGDKYPLYIFVDRLSGRQFEREREELYNRLISFGFYLVEKDCVKVDSYIISFEEVAISKWKNNQDCNKEFFIIYIKNDAVRAFEIIYLNNGILPKCICNYRYEISNRMGIEQAEKEVEFVLGYCHSKEFEVIDECEYYGDYSFETKVKVNLFRKKY